MESSAKPILYSYWRSSASWRVRIVLQWKGVEYEYRNIDLLNNSQNSEDYKKNNPMGRVPALIVNGHCLGESVAIMEYLEETHKDRPMLPSDPIKRAIVRQLVEIVNSGVQPLQNISVINMIDSFGQDKKAWTQHWIKKGLAAFEEIISTSRGKYCVGDQITFADAVLMPQLYGASRFEVDISPYKNIKEISEVLKELPEFKAAHPDVQPDA